jgi:hypothetical protein
VACCCQHFKTHTDTCRLKGIYSKILKAFPDGKTASRIFCALHYPKKQINEEEK